MEVFAARTAGQVVAGPNRQGTGRLAVDVEEAGALVRSAAAGDPAAWRALVAGFGGLVWSVARAHHLNRADAEDVYQVTWLRLAEHIGRLKQPERVGAWLATTARNESVKVIRAGARLTLTGDERVFDRGSDDASPERLAIDAEEAAGKAERVRQVWAAFGRLPERCQRLLRVLLAAPPPSYAEVAEGLGIPIGSIGPTRARCLGRLRALVTKAEMQSQPR